MPADLIPYLDEADAPDEDEQEAEDAAQSAAAAEEAERTEALRQLVAHSLLLGPDPSILAEIEGEDPGEDIWGEEDGGADDAGAGKASHDAALDAAERQVALDERVAEIYRDIVARAPEHKVQPSTSRVEAVLDILGDPQDVYPSVHITGTNGKTSTARMVDSLLSALGMKVGRFTSPHLQDVRERISLEGEPISREGFIAAWEDVAPYIDMVDRRSLDGGGPRLSFFEVFTVMAFAAFADHPVDAAVVEVGMGGLWDATNVMDGDVAVIMPIDLDHQKWLGASVEEIAREKAGIIKPHQTVVIAHQPDSALEVLLERAREVDAVVRLEGVDFEVLGRQLGVGGQMVTIRTPAAVYEDVFVPLLGEHQAHNAAAALVAAEALRGGNELDGRVVEEGFMKATSPGRLQVVRTSPTVVVDAAHNPAGARTLRDALEEAFAFTHVVGVFSAMADKDVEGMLSELEPVLDHLVVTAMESERAMDVEDLRRIAEDVFGPDRVDVREVLADAVDRAVEVTEETLDPSATTGIVVFGSIVLAGEATTLFGPRR
ncbi:bifunctional folylpolyglutamate synthase/dihydrofolate synthase [Actinomyces provencensis]|uniref:bifunctional folylpolyglutamate synthase/dihydrofolate synthase n=1 Tax=Actinomyces provencensis TaxID=1720198 RepID=UPI00096A9684|nr:folylpolyglutamate synthase/dihydrofolate synthase family protein [Actinomyces provencensis]